MGNIFSLVQYMYISLSLSISLSLAIHTYFELILTHSSKHRTWMGIDMHLPIQNLADFGFTVASTPINTELKQALNHNWHAWIRVVLNAANLKFRKTRTIRVTKIGALPRFLPLCLKIPHLIILS